MKLIADIRPRGNTFILSCGIECSICRKPHGMDEVDLETDNVTVAVGMASAALVSGMKVGIYALAAEKENPKKRAVCPKCWEMVN